MMSAFKLQELLIACHGVLLGTGCSYDLMVLYGVMVLYEASINFKIRTATATV